MSAIDNAGSWGVRGIAAPQNIVKVEAAFFEEIGRALKEGFTAEEVANAKSGFLRAREQARSQDGTVAAGWANNLYLDRTWEFSRKVEERVLALKPGEVNAALRKYLDPAKMSVFKAGDFAKAAK